MHQLITQFGYKYHIGAVYYGLYSSRQDKYTRGNLWNYTLIWEYTKPLDI